MRSIREEGEQVDDTGGGLHSEEPDREEGEGGTGVQGEVENGFDARTLALLAVVPKPPPRARKLKETSPCPKCGKAFVASSVPALVFPVQFIWRCKGCGYEESRSDAHSRQEQDPPVEADAVKNPEEKIDGA